MDLSPTNSIGCRATGKWNIFLCRYMGMAKMAQTWCVGQGSNQDCYSTCQWFKLHSHCCTQVYRAIALLLVSWWCGYLYECICPAALLITGTSEIRLGCQWNLFHDHHGHPVVAHWAERHRKYGRLPENSKNVFKLFNISFKNFASKILCPKIAMFCNCDASSTLLYSDIPAAILAAHLKTA